MSESPLALACAYTDGDDGVYAFRLDESDGSLEQLTRTPITSTSYVAVHPSGQYAYTADRVDGGVLTAHRVDHATGDLERLNRRSSHGESPCYVSVDATGSYAFVSTYRGGTVSAYPIEDDGSLGEATDTVHHEGGSGVVPDRQGAAHPHSAGPGPDNAFLYVPDLGADRVAIYEIDHEGGNLEPADTPSVESHDGAGPRHFDFHPNGRVGYVLNELDSTLSVFERDPATGALTERQTVETLPADYDPSGGEHLAADVHVHPSGGWVFASNRGHDSIAIFEVDERTGDVALAGHESTQGHWPRHFALGPSGEYLYAENRRSDTVVPFAIDAEAGTLTATGERYEMPEPSCLAFVEQGG